MAVRSIEIDVDGERFSGRYVVESGVVRVSVTFAGSGGPFIKGKATQVGGGTSERLARILLGELVAEFKKA